MPDPLWQFWIDVGGTFTDCVAYRPDGELLRHKCLSSGVTKGTIGVGSTDVTISDTSRNSDPADFWVGSVLRIVDSRGELIEEMGVADFNRATGELKLRSPLAMPPQIGAAYELATGDEASIQAIRYLAELAPTDPMPSALVRLGTTRGTNALLTRRGAKTALVTTAGFRDALEIGYQDRPQLFELSVQKQAPFCRDVVEIGARIAADGMVLTEPNPVEIRAALDELRNRGIESLAICLLHADRFPAHEELVEQLAREVGFEEISRSSEVAPVIKLVARGDTTLVDAYLNPVLRSYIAGLQQSLGKEGGHDLRLLTSAGGLVGARRFRGIDSILSGPAGGVVGVARITEAAGFRRAIGFDMGGTSTDVSRFDGRFDLEYETEKAGVRLVTPMMSIETVAAGGGSLCQFDGVKLVVGPESAGAAPGPACYGRGGPLALTDVNLFLGRILPDDFPFWLDRAIVDEKLGSLCGQIADRTGQRLTPTELAEGFLAIANQHMAQAIRSISVAKGYDPRDYVLVAFGGAAPQHACQVAEHLRIQQILCHSDAGVLSAYGVGMADITRHGVAGIYRAYTSLSADEITERLEALGAPVRNQVLAEGIPASQVSTTYLLDMRYRGTDAALTISQPVNGDYAAAFVEQHQQLYGYSRGKDNLEVVAARVEVIGRSAPGTAKSVPAGKTQAAVPQSSTSLFCGEEFQQAQVYRSESLRAGDTIKGPAVVLDGTSTTIIDSGWSGEILTGRELLISRDGGDRSESGPIRSAGPTAGQVARSRDHEAADPVLLEIFNSHFVGIAEQMGSTLRNTAVSVNVKERLDFSCALFTATGDLVVNAPHIPVHLGAMGETVKHVLIDHPQLATGDVVVSNDPYRGGSHLPDITVVTPVHDASDKIRFFVANRAHHAEIGGIAPGSMSPCSTNLSEEGVLIRSFKVIERGESRLKDLGKLFRTATFPSRNVDLNLADISAQIAANQRGVRDLLKLIDELGWPLVAANMNHIQQAAETQVRAALRRIPNGKHRFTDHLDDGSPIAVTITVNEESAIFDFAGTGPVLPGNLNANRAIVTAAVMYCLRCLVRNPIPLNEGVLRPVEVRIPESLLNPPDRGQARNCAAVSGGNVETSQRVVDVILGALGAAAASQGTMNNVLFGNRRYSYYETICGGAGATAEVAGADAVQTHMTNTRITDPEILEQRFPVRVNEFSIRRGSGGKGRNPGGDGIIRRIEFLEELELSLVTQRRGPYPPYGLEGGDPGACGVNELRREDGAVEPLPSTTQVTVHPGDELSVLTPGGGGFGSSEGA